MKVNENFSVLFWLFKAKKTKDGLVTIYVRLTVYVLNSLLKKNRPVFWSEETGLPLKQCPDYKTITNYIIKTTAELESHYNKLTAIHCSNFLRLIFFAVPLPACQLLFLPFYHLNVLLHHF